MKIINTKEESEIMNIVYHKILNKTQNLIIGKRTSGVDICISDENMNDIHMMLSKFKLNFSGKFRRKKI